MTEELGDRREIREGGEKAEREPYEPPQIESLGTMIELTEGMAFFVLDGSGLGPSSDVQLKERIEPVDPHDVLGRLADVPVSTWNYWADESAVRHMGPMAQD